jgi:hypothetical protein
LPEITLPESYLPKLRSNSLRADTISPLISSLCATVCLTSRTV